MTTVFATWVGRMLKKVHKASYITITLPDISKVNSTSINGNTVYLILRRKLKD